MTNSLCPLLNCRTKQAEETENAAQAADILIKAESREGVFSQHKHMMTAHVLRNVPLIMNIFCAGLDLQFSKTKKKQKKTWDGGLSRAK